MFEKLKQRLKAIYQRELFRPGIIGLFINPYFIARRGLLKRVRMLGHQVQGKTLDVGCGIKPYESFFNASEYTGLELDTENTRAAGYADVFYDGGKFPFKARAFDSIVLNQVLEHVFDLDVFLSEVHRVLKQHGKVFITVPFVWDEHEKPYDCARYTSFGLKAIMEKAGFEVLEQQRTVDNVAAFFQLYISYLVSFLSTRSTALNIIISFIFLSPITVLGCFFGFLLPKHPDLFLDNIMLVRKT